VRLGLIPPSPVPENSVVFTVRNLPLPFSLPFLLFLLLLKIITAMAIEYIQHCARDLFQSPD
jgi:cell division protein FtsL